MITAVVGRSRRVVSSLVSLNITFSGGKTNFSCAGRNTRSQTQVLRYGSVANGRVGDGLVTQIGRLGGIDVLRGDALISLLITNSHYRNTILHSRTKGLSGICTRSALLTANNVNNLFDGAAGFTRLANSTVTVTLGRNVHIGSLSCIRVRPASLCAKHSNETFLVSRSLHKRNTVLMNGSNRHFTSRLLPHSLLAGTVCARVRGSHLPCIQVLLGNRMRKSVTKEFPNVRTRYLRRNCSLIRSCVPVIPTRRCFVNNVTISLGDGASLTGLCTTKRADYGNIRKGGHLTDGSLLRDLIFDGHTTRTVSRSFRYTLPCPFPRPSTHSVRTNLGRTGEGLLRRVKVRRRTRTGWSRSPSFNNTTKERPC